MGLKEQEKGNTKDMESLSKNPSSSSSIFSAGSLPASASVSQTPTVSTLLSTRPESHNLPRPIVSECEEVSNREKFVLVIVTGGTLCMKKNEKGNYVPAKGFLNNAIGNISLL